MIFPDLFQPMVQVDCDPVVRRVDVLHVPPDQGGLAHPDVAQDDHLHEQLVHHDGLLLVVVVLSHLSRLLIVVLLYVVCHKNEKVDIGSTGGLVDTGQVRQFVPQAFLLHLALWCRLR